MQSAFDHSTGTVLTRITNDMATNIDAGSVTYLFLQDYIKASDLINHDLLMAKLQYYSIKHAALRWFQCYFTDRSRAVRVDGICSREVRVACGVSQGSILDPIVYCAYTVDLVREVNLRGFSVRE